MCDRCREKIIAINTFLDRLKEVHGQIEIIGFVRDTDGEPMPIMLIEAPPEHLIEIHQLGRAAGIQMPESPIAVKAREFGAS